MDTESGRPANVLPVPRWTILIHGIQILLAIIVLGLSAYGVRWIAYNALIFAIVVALVTLLVSIYIIGTSLFLHKLYNKFIVLGLHILMIIFWIVDLGLVANLAHTWSTYDDYSYGYYYYYYPYAKRDLFKRRETTTYKTYYGCLTAGAVFAAFEFALWVLSAVFVVIYLNKSIGSNNNAAPPAYANNGQAVQMENKAPYQAATTGQPHYDQPAFAPQPQPVYNQNQPHMGQVPPHHQQQANVTPGPYHQQPTNMAPGPYAPDPVNREATVSPVSQAAYSNTGNTSEMAVPQHTGGYNPNASELSTKA